MGDSALVLHYLWFSFAKMHFPKMLPKTAPIGIAPTSSPMPAPIGKEIPYDFRSEP